jgi:molybdate transport system substrate-binding protein
MNIAHWERLVAVGFLAITALLPGVEARAAEVKVMVGGPLSGVFGELGAQMERETGHRIVLRATQTAVVKQEIDAGETFDLVVSATPAIDDWIKAGKVVAGSRAAVAYTGLGAGVRAGASKPEMGSVAASRRMLLEARSVSHGAESASATSFRALLDRLGIAEEMKPRLKPMGLGGTYKVVASGEVEIVVAPVPGIIAAPGIDLVGSFPPELQDYVGFAAGVSANARNAEAAQAVIRFLSSPQAVATIRAKGMEPGAPVRRR